MGAVGEATVSEIEAVYRTNVFGLLNVTRAVLPFMRRAISGKIIGDYADTVGEVRTIAAGLSHSI